ncbi:MAG: orotidine-5'-phosphate decarboxylase [Eubacterium sp.]|nr:orotidine-5'-phosphate decarboxylase [Eubacterium sp.]
MISQLIEKIREKQAPVVVGLDPMLSYIPQQIVKEKIADHGETLKAAAEAFWEFNRQIVDAVCDLIPAVKPQSAMYEQFGVPGVEVYERTVSYCQEKGLVVIGDVKRGDIGSTSAAYAAGHLGHVQIGSTRLSGFHEDFATVNPYLGSDGIRPFLDVCRSDSKGIFVLVKTSNPSSGEFQDREIEGTPLYEIVGRQTAAWAEEAMDGEYSEVGAVVGATYPEMAKRLRGMLPHSYILVPGYGAQGGKAEDLPVFFHDNGLGAIVNSSRGIICAYQKEQYAEFGETAFADASRQAVIDMIEDIRQYVVVK